MGLDGDGDLFAVIVIFLGAIAVVFLVWWLVIPFLLLVVDVTVLLVAAVLALLTRVLLRRPWDVVIEQCDEAVASVKIVGWRKARRVRDAMTVALADGLAPDEAVTAWQEVPGG